MPMQTSDTKRIGSPYRSLAATECS
jgi:hypothetical protein